MLILIIICIHLFVCGVSIGLVLFNAHLRDNDDSIDLLKQVRE